LTVDQSEVVCTHVRLSPSSTVWYPAKGQWCRSTGKVGRGWTEYRAESNGKSTGGFVASVTCVLTDHDQDRLRNPIRSCGMRDYRDLYRTASLPEPVGCTCPAYRSCRLSAILPDCFDAVTPPASECDDWCPVRPGLQLRFDVDSTSLWPFNHWRYDRMTYNLSWAAALKP